MNRFLKKNKLWLSFLGLGIAIVLLAFLFRPVTIHYQVSAEESLKLVNNPSVQVGIADLAGKQIIDVRPSNIFAQGHPENAINLPIRQLLDEESVEIFDDLLASGKEAILYGCDELQATAPWLLLQQLGYKNIKLLKGGINPLGKFNETAAGATEVSVIDTSAFRIKTEVKNATEITQVKKKPQVVITVKKEVSSGGGC
ncbi:MAG: rhodanese-like domain-containing protein [Bacteroidota bacterium]|nr:hypothetical protein [Odoribacter sp.]MDP3645096.1 rhodanese-like domain-containing protein [Bacteroidota bacterium]